MKAARFVLKVVAISMAAAAVACAVAAYWDRIVDVFYAIADKILKKTGKEVRVTVPGHMQRGGTPTCKDRVYASIMGAKAAMLLSEGKSNRVVAYKNGEYVDFDIQEALQMKKDIPEDQFEICKLLVR